MSNIPGYTHGTSAVAKSPLTLTDFDQMKASVLFGEDDVKYLRMSHDVVKDEVEAIERRCVKFPLFGLQRRPYARNSVQHAKAFGSAEQPQVGHTIAFQKIKLFS